MVYQLTESGLTYIQAAKVEHVNVMNGFITDTLRNYMRETAGWNIKACKAQKDDDLSSALRLWLLFVCLNQTP